MRRHTGRLSTELLEARDTPASIGLDADGVLQVRADDVGSSLAVFQDAATGEVSAYFDAGTGLQEFRFSGVTGINFEGGAGTDVFFNATSLSDAADLGAGNDYYVGGTGAVSQVTLGSGNDFALTRAQTNIVDSTTGDDDRHRDFVFNTLGALSIANDANDTAMDWTSTL